MAGRYARAPRRRVLVGLLGLRVVELLLEFLDELLEVALEAVVLDVRDVLAKRRKVRGLEREVGRDLHVGLDARALPVGLGDGADGAARRDEHHEVLVDAEAVAGVRAAARRLADDGRALEVLE